MSNKIELETLSSVTANDARTTSQLNNNFRKINEAINNSLSRDGTQPNYMDAVLDMNSHRIINTADPLSDFDVVNKKYVDEKVGDSKKWADEAAASAEVAKNAAEAAQINADKVAETLEDAKIIEQKLNSGDYAEKTWVKDLIAGIGTGGQKLYVHNNTGDYQFAGTYGYLVYPSGIIEDIAGKGGLVWTLTISGLGLIKDVKITRTLTEDKTDWCYSGAVICENGVSGFFIDKDLKVFDSTKDDPYTIGDYFSFEDRTITAAQLQRVNGYTYKNNSWNPSIAEDFEDILSWNQPTGVSMMSMTRVKAAKIGLESTKVTDFSLHMAIANDTIYFYKNEPSVRGYLVNREDTRDYWVSVLLTEDFEVDGYGEVIVSSAAFSRTAAVGADISDLEKRVTNIEEELIGLEDLLKEI